MNLWETFIDGCFGGKATEEFAMQRENSENALDLNPVNTNVVIIFDLVIKRLIVYWVGSGTVAEALEATTDKLVTEAPQ